MLRFFLAGVGAVTGITGENTLKRAAGMVGKRDSEDGGEPEEDEMSAR